MGLNGTASAAASLTISVDIRLLKVVMTFVEESAAAFGFDEGDRNRLTLAAEELFSFLAADAPRKGDALDIHCRSRGYCAELEFHLLAGSLPPSAFNLTRIATLADAEIGGQLGLILAARIVDQLFVERLDDDRFALRFVVMKSYPPMESRPRLPPPDGPFHVESADASALAELSVRLQDARLVSEESFLAKPGRLVDMAAAGELKAVILRNRMGEVGGGIVLHKDMRIYKADGPFLFSDAPDLPLTLVEGMLEALARTEHALAVVVMEPTRWMPPGYFERLPGGALYRQLSEDNGARVFAHPCVKTFVEDFYRGLALPRVVQEAIHHGGQLPSCSAFAVSTDRSTWRAELWTLWTGRDFEENLKAHVQLLKSQGAVDIRFRMELDSTEEAMMAPALLSAGFSTWMILPWEGRGDVALFRRVETPAG